MNLDKLSEGEQLEALKLLQLKECGSVQGLSREDANALYDGIFKVGNQLAQRLLCKTDLFFLLTRGLKRRDADKDWLFARCREVEASPNGHLDLWARDHYKSTIITFSKTIQDILADPDTTIGIFSHTRPIAKGFLEQIKRELEQNEYLKKLFPDVIYEKPESEAPKWSLDSGIIVKRKSNPKEATVEAWGLVDGQPTGKHFKIQVYDDVVTLGSVTTPEQIKKTIGAWELSLNLGANNSGIRRYIGTRYHKNDPYHTMMERGSVRPRIYPATDNGKLDGNSVFLPQALLLEKRRDMGPYTFGTQMLQDPVADKSMGFREEWISYYKILSDISRWNKYILIDPANSKKETADYTVIAVLGLAPDGNYYLIDGLRDRLNLTQRADALFRFHEKYRPLDVGYERYGMQSDIEHIKFLMEQRNYRFNITELGGTLSKEDRIQKLIPVFEQRRFYLPESLNFIDYQGVVRDFVKLFVNDEYLAFPVSIHDDMLDCIARILDPALNAQFPKLQPPKPKGNYSGYSGGGSSGWMG